MAGIQEHREEESAPRLRRYFNSLSSHLATLDTSVRLFGDVIFFIRIAGIIAERRVVDQAKKVRSLDIWMRREKFEIHIKANIDTKHK